MGGGALGPVELLFRPWYGPRGMLGGLAPSDIGLSNPVIMGRLGTVGIVQGVPGHDGVRLAL